MNLFLYKKKEEGKEIIYIKRKKRKEKEVEDGDEMVVFLYEFTERIIDVLSCKFCGGIYIRPYVINVDGCYIFFVWGAS